MKKYLISFATIGLFGIYALYQYLPQQGSLATAVTTTAIAPAPETTPTPNINTARPVVTKTPTPTSAPTSGGATSGGTSSSGLTDGTYVGVAADAYYGNVQVKAVISGGKLTNVVTLQSPGGREDSIRINSRALPALRAEAISAQSANVDTVSGATDTSDAYRASLASALSQA